MDLTGTVSELKSHILVHLDSHPGLVQEEHFAGLFGSKGSSRWAQDVEAVPIERDGEGSGMNGRPDGVVEDQEADGEEGGEGSAAGGVQLNKSSIMFRILS